METSEYLKVVVVKLAREIGVRSYRHMERLDRTADYIAEELASLGLAVSRQPVSFDGRTYHNVIGELAGRRHPERIMVVGAHYDSVTISPGADDNASGVAGLLGIARLLSGKQPDKTVRFAAFTLEEPPAYRSSRMGSYQYARSLSENNNKVEGMICLEMIGYFRDFKGSQHYPLPFFKLKYPSVGNYIAFVGNMRSKKFTEETARDFRMGTDLPVTTLNAPPIVIGIDFSDHWSFNKFGYKALMVTDTAFYRNPNYHAPSDVPETLDYSRMEKVVKGLAHAVEEWSKE